MVSHDPVAVHSAAMSAYSEQAKNLLKALQPENRYKFIQPPKEICDGALDLAKVTLDGFAGALVDEQTKRIQEGRKDKKRKRDAEATELLKIRKVHTKGFQVEQVWEQARRVIDALKAEVEKDLVEFEDSEEESGEEESEEEDQENGVSGMKFDEDGFEMGSDDESLEDGRGEEEEAGSEEDEAEEEFDEPFPQAEGEDDDMDMEMEGQNDFEGSEDEEEESNDDEFVEDQFGLNDGFFSIDDFNKQTEFLEQQDANADPFTGEASDEEEVDWDADPMAAPAPTAGKKADAEESEDEDDEGGPTFGNMDLNAPEGDSEDEDEEMEDVDDAPGDNTNDILYKDFFKPPPRKVTKAEKQASYLARQEKKKAAEPEDTEGDVERAMADVRRDLFDEESDVSEDELSELDAADPKSRRSAHERRQAKLAEEIRKLEAASVQKREWTLSGEAKAADRPVNSLLEEDLDFERTGKPVPVITAEVSESIEELIKRRIIAQEFDEVIRRRPDSDAPVARRGAFELDDTKDKKSLAEMYEEEHVKMNNPETYVSAQDEKLKKQHTEIENLWKEVSAKLDALSSWHYKPKPAAPSLTVVSDVATVAMEDAQPTMASGIAGADSMLAPQEIYKAGKDDKDSRDNKEIVPKTGAPVAREEMSREEKLRRRRREKERIKKRGGEIQNKRPESKKAQQKREITSELKKAGVKVIGRRGDIKDMEGNKVKAAQITDGAGGFKL